MSGSNIGNAYAQRAAAQYHVAQLATQQGYSPQVIYVVANTVGTQERDMATAIRYHNSGQIFNTAINSMISNTNATGSVAVNVLAGATAATSVTFGAVNNTLQMISDTFVDGGINILNNGIDGTAIVNQTQGMLTSFNDAVGNGIQAMKRKFAELS
jgi:hypothetical protein